MKKQLRVPRVAIYAFIFVFLSISSLNLAASPSALKHLKKATSKQPERFSELYFSNYSQIPKELKVGKSYPVEFSIVNHEYRRMVYFYKAILIEDDKSKVIGQGKLGIKNNQFIKQKIKFLVSKPNKWVKVKIELLNINQQIQFSAKTI